MLQFYLLRPHYFFDLIPRVVNFWVDTVIQEQRDQVLAALNQLQSDKKKLVEELDRHKDCDPEVMEQMKEDAVVAREAANRWTGATLLVQ